MSTIILGFRELDNRRVECLPFTSVCVFLLQGDECVDSIYGVTWNHNFPHITHAHTKPTDRRLAGWWLLFVS